MPEHRKYVEPFGGGAGVLLQKPRVYAEVYNDLDGDLVNFFRVMQDDQLREKLIQSCYLTPYAREEFKLAFLHTDDPVDRARRLAIRASMGFGSAGATKGTTGFRIDTDRAYGTAMANWARYPDGLAQIGKRFVGVLVENRPALQVIEQHDTEDTLFFIDPPYLHSTRAMGCDKTYYQHEMNDVDHQALIETARLVKGMVLLCGYPNELYDRLLPDWTQVQTRARKSAHRGTSVATEVMWINPRCWSALQQQHSQLELIA
jgi:DNA adenine methylase